MPTTHNTSVEKPYPDYSQYDKDNSTTKPQALLSNPQQSESRSTAAATTGRPPRHDSQDTKPHTGKRGSRKCPSDSLSGPTTTAIRTNRPLTDRQKPRTSNSNSNRVKASDGDSSDSHDLRAPRNQEHGIPTSNPGRSTGMIKRLSLNFQSPSFAHVAQQPQGETEDPSVKGVYPSARKPQDAQVPPGHHSEDGHQDHWQPETVENKQSQAMAPQVSGYGRGKVTGIVGAAVDSIMSFMPKVGSPPPKDRYHRMTEEYYRIRNENKQLHTALDNYDRELRRTNGDLSKANHFIKHLHWQQELQRSRDTINGLQNELIQVHQQVEDAKTLSEVLKKELIGTQVFLTKADTLSISEVGEKVTALNEEISQAAATLGEALIHERYDSEVVSQRELEAAGAMAREMVGEKMTNILIAQAQKKEPRVDPLLVQVVLQIFMVNFCVSKIQSWYPGDTAIGEFLSTIYSEIQSTEEQSVAGRWRALTRAQTRPSTETWNKEIYKKLQSLLIIASWAPRTPDDEESYGNRLPSVFKAINELRMAIGENFTSADLDIYVFECDMIFDPTIMEDAYGDGRQSSGKRAPEPIVGTTCIGLGKVREDSENVLHDQILIPAKIVLTSTMNEALEPMQPQRGRKKTRKPFETTDGANQDGRD